MQVLFDDGDSAWVKTKQDFLCTESQYYNLTGKNPKPFPKDRKAYLPNRSESTVLKNVRKDGSSNESLDEDNVSTDENDDGDGEESIVESLSLEDLRQRSCKACNNCRLIDCGVCNSCNKNKNVGAEGVKEVCLRKVS